MSSSSNAWDVWLKDPKVGYWRHIDTVFDSETDPKEVKRSLVNHDGYSPDILVIKATTRKRIDDNQTETESVTNN